MKAGHVEVPVTVLSDVTPLQVESILLESNRQRVKTTLQIQHETAELARIVEALAAVRSAANLKQNRHVTECTEPVQSDKEAQAKEKKAVARTTDVVAAKTGQSRETVEKRLKIARAVERQEPKAKEAMKVLERGGTVSQAHLATCPAEGS